MSIECGGKAISRGNRRNSVETPLHHHSAEYYTKSHEMSHTLDQGRIYREANEA